MRSLSTRVLVAVVLVSVLASSAVAAALTPLQQARLEEARTVLAQVWRMEGHADTPPKVEVAPCRRRVRGRANGWRPAGLSACVPTGWIRARSRIRGSPRRSPR
jgi:hypothetical protein